MKFKSAIICILFALSAATAGAEPKIVTALACEGALVNSVGIVKKQVFELRNFRTEKGTVLDVRVGYETYGTLNKAGDNAIFIPHFFSGNSHAAGKYKAEDPAQGYWDSIIGPGKAVDTNKFFVIAADSFNNLNKDANTITTSADVTVADNVNLHKALVDSLGVKHLAAVMGASGGGMNAMVWSVRFPFFVSRVVNVVGPGLSLPPQTAKAAKSWLEPLLKDPEKGLPQATALLTMTAMDIPWDKSALAPGDYLQKEVPEGMRNMILGAAATRAQAFDGKNFARTVQMNSSYDYEAEAGKIRAKFLFVPATSDHLFPPSVARAAADKLRVQGNLVKVFEITGKGGHLDGILIINQAAEEIRNFLD